MKNNLVIFLVILGALAGIFYFSNQKKVDIRNPNGDAFVDIKAPVSSEANSETVSSTTESLNNISNINDNKKIMIATLKTNMGDIEIEFLDSQAPKTVENFIKLAKSGFYDGVKFHRVIKGFMIQGGDPLSTDDSQVDRWGSGGPGYKFADEISTTNKNDVGTIAMANSGPNTNGSQFFINTNANNFLDPKHTVFGKVVSGLEVVRAIENSPTDENDRPVKPVIIQSIVLK